MKNIYKGKKATGYFSYLNQIEDLCNAKCRVSDEKSLKNIDILDEALAVRAAYLIK